LFRDHIATLFDDARKDIIAITGELGSYDFPDLRQATHRAVKRGVSVDFYANHPRPAVVKELRERSVGITVGKLRSQNHYLAVDKKHVVVSYKDGTGSPTTVGERRGTLYRNDGELARAVADYRRFLQDSAEKCPTPQVVSQLMDRIAKFPATGRRIPLADNLLQLAGWSGKARQEFLEGTRDRMQSWMAETAGKRAGPETETALMNEIALTTYLLGR